MWLYFVIAVLTSLYVVLFSVHCTVYTVQCTVYSTHTLYSTVCIVHICSNIEKTWCYLLYKLYIRT